MTAKDGSFNFAAADGTKIFCRRWADVSGQCKGAVQIAHGAAEHSGRYERFARFLNDNGYAVYANDHRGHGRTRVRSGELGDAGPDAWNRIVGDARELTDRVRGENPRRPITLFGHSMGSFLAQDYMARYGKSVDAVLLCATHGVFDPPAQVIAAFDQAARADPLSPSRAFSDRWATFNQQFTPGKPGFDWLSRDPAEVQEYINDPLCGFAFSNELARDFIVGLRDLFLPERESRIPRDMPVFIIAGDNDPVGANTTTILPLLQRYRDYGLTRLDYKFYPGARHELLNESNRDAVQRDILGWLDSIV